MASPEQLRLPFAPASAVDGAPLPQLDLARDWKAQPRSWPHALHPMCTYLGSLPATLAHDLVARWSRPGDVVLDPFCGRGTVPLQAGLERRIGVGIDRNPLAHLLTAAALDPPTRREALGRLEHLRIRWTETRDDWREVARSMSADGGPATFFHAETLAQLLLARSELDRCRAGRCLPAGRHRGHPPWTTPHRIDRCDAQHVQHGPGIRCPVAVCARLRDRLGAARPGPVRGPGAPAGAAAAGGRPGDAGHRHRRRRTRRGHARGCGAAGSWPSRPGAPGRDQSALSRARPVRTGELAAAVAAGRGPGTRRWAARSSGLGGGVGRAAAAGARRPPADPHRRRGGGHHRGRCRVRSGAPPPSTGRPGGRDVDIGGRAGGLSAGRREHGRHRSRTQAHAPVGRPCRWGVTLGSAAGHRPHGAGSTARARQRQPGGRPRADARRSTTIVRAQARYSPDTSGRGETRYPRDPCSRCTTRTTWHRWIRSS